MVRSLDNKVVSLGPKEAVPMTKQQSGGMLKAECLSDLPRGPRQGYYRSQLQKETLPSHVKGGQKQDQLLEVLLTMKTDKEPFFEKLPLRRRTKQSLSPERTS